MNASYPRRSLKQRAALFAIAAIASMTTILVTVVGPMALNGGLA
jgi:hypothetical protein